MKLILNFFKNIKLSSSKGKSFILASSNSVHLIILRLIILAQ